MARTVADVALLLQAIAGPDGLDPRQAADVRVDDYVGSLTGDVADLRIGLLDEAFGLPGVSEGAVDTAVREAASAFRDLGATVTEVSVPAHRQAPLVWLVVAISEAADLVSSDDGQRWAGYYDTRLVDAYSRARVAGAHTLPDTVKLQ